MGRTDTRLVGSYVLCRAADIIQRATASQIRTAVRPSVYEIDGDRRANRGVHIAAGGNEASAKEHSQIALPTVFDRGLMHTGSAKTMPSLVRAP